MDLLDPYHKMSKSGENEKGIIRMLDKPEVIRKKIMGAVTDSEAKVKFDMENKPGVSNLMNIYSAVTGKAYKEIEKEFENSNYGEFKKCVADEVISEISMIQDRYYEIIGGTELDEILDDGINITRKIAKEKYENMKKKMGLGR